MDKKENLINLLQKLSKFEKVPYNELKTIASYAYFTSYSSGEYIYKDEETASYFYIILSGEVEIFNFTDKLNEKIFCTLHPGDEFGHVDLLTNPSIHSNNAKATSQSEIALFSKKNFIKLISECKNFNLSILTILSGVIKELQTDVIISHVEVKLLSLFKLLAIKIGEYDKTHSTILIPKKIVLDKVAKMLNLTREAVSRNISLLQKKNIIKKEKGFFTIINPSEILKDSLGIYISGFYGADFLED